MKKSTPDTQKSKHTQKLSKEAVRSVVTRLEDRGKRIRVSAEPEVDLEALRAAIDELPEIDATKVVSLHRRIVNGDYKLDAQRLAEKMIELESSIDKD